MFVVCHSGVNQSLPTHHCSRACQCWETLTSCLFKYVSCTKHAYSMSMWGYVSPSFARVFVCNTSCLVLRHYATAARSVSHTSMNETHCLYTACCNNAPNVICLELLQSACQLLTATFKAYLNTMHTPVWSSAPAHQRACFRTCFKPWRRGRSL